MKLRMPQAIRRPEFQSVVTGVAMQTVLLLSGVVVARALGPTDRGYLALLALVPVLLWQLGSLGLPVATTYFVAQDPSRRREVSRAMRRPALIQCAVLVPCTPSCCCC